MQYLVMAGTQAATTKGEAMEKNVTRECFCKECDGEEICAWCQKSADGPELLMASKGGVFIGFVSEQEVA